MATRKTTVAATATDGSYHAYSAGQKMTKNTPHCSRHSYRQAGFQGFTVAATATQVSVAIPRRFFLGLRT